MGSRKISSQAATAAYDGVTTKEIKMWVYDSLKHVDNEMVDKYLSQSIDSYVGILKV